VITISGGNVGLIVKGLSSTAYLIIANIIPKINSANAIGIFFLN